MADRLDVVVVGAGPVGLSLALGLARAGRRVLVLENEAGTAEHSRAPAIWPRTQEVLAGLGVIDRFLERGIVIRRAGIHDADRDRTLLVAPLEELADETPFPQLLIVPQSVTESLLAAAVRSRPSAEVRFSCEVTALEPAGSSVRVTYRPAGSGPPADGAERTVEAAFVVGCDGAHSTVREVLGADFDGITYSVKAGLADVELKDARDLPFPRVSTRGPRPSIALRIDERLWRLILPFSEEDRIPLDDRVEWAVTGLFPKPIAAAGYDTVWKSEFRLHRRVSSIFAHGRIALAGDAAHVNSPVGGQGMNAGIQDTEGLTRALLVALESDDPAPVAEYGRRRREEVVTGVNRFTDRLTRIVLAAGGRLVKPMIALAGLALRVPSLRRRILRRMAMLGDR